MLKLIFFNLLVLFLNLGAEFVSWLKGFIMSFDGVPNKRTCVCV